jgi:TRAP-type transport system large permease protein
METVIRGTTPFLAAYVLMLALFVVFPGLVTTPLGWLR